MRHEELANWCQSYATYCASDDAMNVRPECARVAEDANARIMAAGLKYQISEDEQGFERSTVGNMLVGLREELLDVINYAAMIDVLANAHDVETVTMPDTGKTFSVFASMSNLRADLERIAGATVLTVARIDLHIAELIALGQHVPQDGSFEDHLAAEIAGASQAA